MLAQRPIAGAALASVTIPPPVADTIIPIARGRATEFAVVLEVTGFPKQYSPEGTGSTPLLSSPLLAHIGLLDEIVSNDIAFKTLFLSDYPYRTKPSDQHRPSLWTEARMTRRADVEQNAPVSQVASRRAQQTVGDLEFADNDGFIRDISDDYSFEGRPARVHLVRVGDPWVRRATISQSVVRRITRSRGSARFNLEDAANFLDTPLVPRVYQGNGLRDGSIDLRDTSPPVGYGYCRNAKPLLEDPSIYLYRLSDYGVNAVHAVEERGIAFNFDEDVASYELLRLKADTLNEGEYATCIVDGSIVIKFAGGSPLDPDAIRVTFEGDKSSGTYVAFMGDVLKSMALYSMGVPASRLDLASFDELPLYPISYYFPGGTVSPTGAQAFNTVMASAFGCFGSVNSDKVGAKLFYPPGDQVAVQTIIEEEIFGVEEIEPPQEAIWSMGIGWGTNQSPMTRDQLAVGSLTETQIEERTRLSEATVYVENPNLFAANLAAVSGAIERSSFETQAGALDAANRLMGVWGIYSKAFEIECAFTAADVKRGSVIAIEHYDLGDKSGGKFLVYGRRLQLSKRRVLLTVVG